MSGAENGAERAENRVSGSGAVSGHSRKRLSGSGAWSGRPRSASGAESGLNRLTRNIKDNKYLLIFC